MSSPVEKLVENVLGVPVEHWIYFMWITACAYYYDNYCVELRALYTNHILSRKTNFGNFHPFELIIFQIKSWE